MAANRIGNAADGRKPVLPRERRPRGIRRTRRGDGRFHVLAVAFLKRAERDARVDGAAVVELRVRLQVRAVDVEKMLAAEGLRCVCDGGVQLAMQIFERVASKRRVGDLGSHMYFGSAVGSVRLQPDLGPSNHWN